MAKVTDPPVLYVVVKGFYAEPDPYREGEVIHPDDPYIALMPDRFGPFAFPHPVKIKRAVTLGAPEVLAE
jgi:hypothetical protein